MLVEYITNKDFLDNFRTNVNTEIWQRMYSQGLQYGGQPRLESVRIFNNHLAATTISSANDNPSTKHLLKYRNCNYNNSKIYNHLEIIVLHVSLFTSLLCNFFDKWRNLYKGVKLFCLFSVATVKNHFSTTLYSVISIYCAWRDTEVTCYLTIFLEYNR